MEEETIIIIDNYKVSACNVLYIGMPMKVITKVPDT